MKKTMLGWALVVALTSVGNADDSPAEFLADPPSARLTALGGSYSALPDGAGSVGTNPALLGLEGHSGMMLSQTSLGSDASGLFGGGVWVLPKRGISLGAGLREQSTDSFEVSDGSGHSSSVSPRQMAGFLGASYKLKQDTIGLTVKNVRVKVVDSASTWAIDGGFVSRPMGPSDIRLGLLVANLGGKLNLGNGSESLPQLVRVGGSMGNWRGLTLVSDLVFPSGGDERLELGAEYGRWFSEDLRGRAQAGWNTRHDPQENTMAEFSVGAGLIFKNVSVDYAAQPFREIGMTQTISLSWNLR